MLRITLTARNLAAIQTAVDDDPAWHTLMPYIREDRGIRDGCVGSRSLVQSNPFADVHMLLGEAFADQGEILHTLEEYRKSLRSIPIRRRRIF